MFLNRKDAGIRLGKLLENQYKDHDVLVLGIPRGGVEVGYYVAKHLNGDLSLIVSKKLPYPGEEEVAFGAITEDNFYYLTPLANSLDKNTINKIIRQQISEVKRRVTLYRGGKNLPDMRGRIVIIVDDGIATGATIVPALKLCRNNNVEKLIVASPVSGKEYSSEIAELADEVKILVQPKSFYAVGQVYEDFHSLSDFEVTSLLHDFEKYKLDKKII